jgi:hypothetical protein
MRSVEVPPRRAGIERAELGMAVEDALGEALAGPDFAKEDTEIGG